MLPELTLGRLPNIHYHELKLSLSGMDRFATWFLRYAEVVSKIANSALKKVKQQRNTAKVAPCPLYVNGVSTKIHKRRKVTPCKQKFNS